MLFNWSHHRGAVVIVSGPSGVGKDTILNNILATDPLLKKCVTMTTRPPRPGEQEGVDYLFRDRKEFDALIDSGYFLEWAEVHSHRYGTPYDQVEPLLQQGFDTLLKIDVQGCAQVTRRIPDLLTIFIVPPSLEELQHRLQSRGTETPQSISKRMANALREMELLSDYEYLVVNDNIDSSTHQVQCILTAHRLKVSRLAELTPREH